MQPNSPTPVALRQVSIVADSQGDACPEVVEYLSKLVLNSTEALDAKGNIECFASIRHRNSVQDPIGRKL